MALYGMYIKCTKLAFRFPVKAKIKQIGNHFLKRAIPARFKKSLISQTIYIVALCSIVSIIITGVIRYTFEYNNSIRTIKENGDIISNRLTYEITLPLWEYNEAMINTSLLLEMANESVFAITVTSSDGSTSGIIRDQNNKIISFNNERDTEKIKTCDYSIPNQVLFNNKWLGETNIYFSFRDAKTKILFNILKDFIVLIITAGFIALAVFLSLKRTVLDHVIQLKESVLNIAKKDFSTRINIESANEIGFLVQSINEMAATIEDYSMNMQFLVKKKTDQLLQAERLAALGGMVSGMAHEINTPLGISLTSNSYAKNILEKINSDFTAGTITKEALRTYIKTLEDSISITQTGIDRSCALVQKFKSTAIDKKNENRDIFSIKSLIHECTHFLLPHYEGKNFKVDIQCKEDLTLDGYPLLLYQLLVNFMLNSIIHGFEGHEALTVTICAESEDDNFILTFIDDGKGIEPDHLSQIFEPFFTTKRNRGGTGLGLAIVYNIVRYNLNGEITCSSTPDNGAVFKVIFPIKH